MQISARCVGTTIVMNGLPWTLRNSSLQTISEKTTLVRLNPYCFRVLKNLYRLINAGPEFQRNSGKMRWNIWVFVWDKETLAECNTVSQQEIYCALVVSHIQDSNPLAWFATDFLKSSAKRNQYGFAFGWFCSKFVKCCRVPSSTSYHHKRWASHPSRCKKKNISPNTAPPDTS